MNSAPMTRPTLLARLRDAHDRAAWEEFVRLYAPVVFAFMRQQGLQDADAADLTQEVFRNVAGAMTAFVYTPERGTFRSWLFTIVRNELRTFRRRVARRERGTGDDQAGAVLAELPDPRDDLAERWEQECRARLFAWAIDQVRPQVSEAAWEAFRLTALEGRSGQEVAAELGMTVAAVYLAKSRVLARLRECIAQINEE